MFYPNVILIHRRKAELTAAWLAATLSENEFKKRYKSASINKINITKICEEVQEIACNRNESGMKFSLYLLSQLMCGITKLHSYQTTYFEKDVFDIQKKLKPTKGEQSDMESDIEPDIGPLLDPKIFDVPVVKDVNPQLHENLDVSQYKNLDDKIDIMMTARTGQDFGALNDEEMREPDATIMEMEKRLRIHDNEERDGTEMVEDIDIAAEIHQERHSSQEMPVLTTLSELNATLLSTPQKRKVQGQIQTGTPTKKRRLSFKDIVVPPIQDVTEGTSVPVQPVAPIVQEIESDIELKSLESSNKSFSSKQSKKMIDKKTMLSDKVCLKWRRDVNIWCRSKIARVHFTPAKSLLTQPSHKLYAACLRPLFDKHFTFNRITRSSSTDENIGPTEPIQLEQPPLRTEKSPSLFGETSELGKKTVIIAGNGSTLPEVSAMPESEMPDIINAVEGIAKDITKHKDYEEKIDINETNETLEDIRNLLEKQHLQSDVNSESSSASSSSTSQNIPLTIQDILGMLEALWCEKSYTSFNELVPDNTSAYEKIKIFYSLLVMHAHGTVVLNQENCRSILYILNKEENIYFD